MPDIALDETLEEQIDALIDTGRFPTRDAVVAEALRLLREREALADLNAKIEEGIADADAGRLHTLEEVRAELAAERRVRVP